MPLQYPDIQKVPENRASEKSVRDRSEYYREIWGTCLGKTRLSERAVIDRRKLFHRYLAWLTNGLKVTCGCKKLYFK